MNPRFDKIAPGFADKINVLIDLALIFAGLIFALGGFQAFNFGAFASLWFISNAAWFIAAAVFRLYSPCTPRRLLDMLVMHTMALFGVVAVATVLEWAFMPTEMVFRASMFVAVLLPGSLIARVVIAGPLVRKFEEPTERVLIVGTGALGVATLQRLLDNHREVVGFARFPGEPIDINNVEAPVLGDAEDMLRIVSEHPVDEVYIAGRVMTQGGYMQDVVQVCEEVGVPFALPLHSLRFERATLLSSSPARDGYLHYLNAQGKPMQFAVKRFLDIVASATALVVLSPLLLTVAVVIKLSSPGPILFRQLRVGMHGATFHLLKFRSMVVDAEALKAKLAALNEQSGPVFKMKNDPRITGIGRFIRKYSIDELPQLVNILRGDMTVVGPRPAVPVEVAQYKAWQRRRLSVRPGLTCYWQVGGRNEIGFEDWMRLDLRYIDNWNLGVDVKLVMQTFPVVLAAKGAS